MNSDGMLGLPGFGEYRYVDCACPDPVQLPAQIVAYIIRVRSNHT